MKMMFIIPGLVLCQTGGLLSSVYAQFVSSAEPLASNDPIVYDKTFSTYFPPAFRSFSIDDSSINELTKEHIPLLDSSTTIVAKPELEALSNYKVLIDHQGKVILEWQTNFEKNVGFFIIEKSTDGRKYIQHGSLKATGNGSTKTAYRCIDRHPSKGVTFYRIKEIKKNLFVKNLAVQKVYLGDEEDVILAQNNQPDSNITAQVNDETTHDLSNNTTVLETAKQTGSKNAFRSNLKLQHDSNDQLVADDNVGLNQHQQR